jgi:hypothetical protein
VSYRAQELTCLSPEISPRQTLCTRSFDYQQTYTTPDSGLDQVTSAARTQRSPENNRPDGCHAPFTMSVKRVQHGQNEGCIKWKSQFTMSRWLYKASCGILNVTHHTWPHFLTTCCSSVNGSWDCQQELTCPMYAYVHASSTIIMNEVWPLVKTTLHLIGRLQDSFKILTREFRQFMCDSCYAISLQMVHFCECYSTRWHRSRKLLLRPFGRLPKYNSVQMTPVKDLGRRSIGYYRSLYNLDIDGITFYTVRHFQSCFCNVWNKQYIYIYYLYFFCS